MIDVEDAQTRGAWKVLCMAVMHEAVVLVHGGSRWGDCSYRADQEKALRWIEKGDIGTITFKECCELTGVNPEVARERIMQFGVRLRRKPAFKRDRMANEAFTGAT